MITPQEWIGAGIFGFAMALLVIFFDRQSKRRCKICGKSDELIPVNAEEDLCRSCLNRHSYLTSDDREEA